MRSRFLFYIFLFTLSSLAIGCYDDEGNYDYKTINEVAGEDGRNLRCT